MDFVWECQPEAEKLVEAIVDACCSENSELAQLRDQMGEQTSTRLFDWVDHVVTTASTKIDSELQRCGFQEESVTDQYKIYYHPGAQLPRVVVYHQNSPIKQGVAVGVESIADYLCVRGISKTIEGRLLGPFRRCTISSGNGSLFWIIERRGTLSIEPSHPKKEALSDYLESLEAWMTRPRDLKDEAEAFKLTLGIAQSLIARLGQDLAAWVVLEGERKYWQAHNVAGQLQKMRQDRLGLGWANHDHHTFRSSRKHFAGLVKLFEMLGFHCRERFYAGKEAGWGAQVMENPRAKLVLFLDVDLGPNEITGDFAHGTLPELNKLGTIGLWCALHGDSILQSGMHHLEAQFSFEELKKDLAEAGVQMMDPFSNFPFLKQAFTKGEMWQVAPWRLEKLLAAGLITAEQAAQFKASGAVGSHMENLQRREGYKGFNQKNVSSIIKSTDPRIAGGTGEKAQTWPAEA